MKNVVRRLIVHERTSLGLGPKRLVSAEEGIRSSPIVSPNRVKRPRPNTDVGMESNNSNSDAFKYHGVAALASIGIAAARYVPDKPRVNGKKVSRKRYPEILISCSRRKPDAHNGVLMRDTNINVAPAPDVVGNLYRKHTNTMRQSPAQIGANHQNSDREARPEKANDLARQVLMD